MTRSWTIRPGEGVSSLTLAEQTPAPVHPSQVRVALEAMSLNARDLLIALGQSPMPSADTVTPVSDAAGTVTEVGAAVNRVAPGDRVVVAFNPAHQSGPYEPYMATEAHGELRSGLLADEAVVDQMALVKLPDSISFEQAACLPCAGVTAWNALFESGPTRPGQTALATGTGAVSLVALHLAKAAGLRFGITSSDDAKLEQARAMGADFSVNYRANAAWHEPVRDATGGVGAHVVLETAGPASVATSIRAAAAGGRVAQIGFKATDGPPLSLLDMAVGAVSLVPIMVGSRSMLERLVDHVAVNDISLPIDSTFAFTDAPLAYNALAEGTAFGKITIVNPRKDQP